MFAGAGSIIAVGIEAAAGATAAALSNIHGKKKNG
jgi:hypothetical protein